jgi:hypothetical protein
MFEESKLGKEALGLRQTIELNEAEPLEKPTIGEIAGAFYRQENLIGAFNSKVEGLPDVREDDPDYDPYIQFTEEEKDDELFVRAALYADNDDELNAVRGQIAREREDRETMARGGATSFIVGLPVMMADPLSLLSIGGVAVNTYRAGRGILKGGAAMGAVTGIDTAVQEAALHTQQLTRTYGESATNIGFGTLLGGVMGGTLAQLSKYGVDEKMIREYETIMDVEPNSQKGINTAVNESTPSVGLDSVGAQRVYGDVQVSGKLAKQITKMLKFDPLSRTLTSKNPFTRQAAVQLAENPIKVDGFDGQAVESLAKTYSGNLALSLENNGKMFREYKNSGGKMNRLKFNESVARAIRTGESNIPQVKQSADYWNDTLYNPLRDRMIEEKLLPEDVSVSTAPNYLNRVYNKDKIAANLPAFVGKVSKWLQDKDLKLFEDARIAQEQLADATGAELKRLEEIIEKAEFKKGKEFEAQDYEEIADQISQRIRSSPDGRLPYDWQIGDGSKNTGSVKGLNVKLRGPLRSRVFNIDDELIEEFLENDIEVLGGRYLQQTAADAELTRVFGDVDMTEAQKQITDWYTQQGKNPKLTEKQRIALNNAKDADIRDLAGMRDRIRGVYGFSPDNVWTRIGRSARDLNYLRLLGGVTVSSLPDVARVFMAEGFAKTFAKGLAPLITNTKNFKIAAQELKAYGVGTDALMTGKSELIADVGDYTQGGTIVERGLRSAANKFGRINFLDHWTAGIKQLHAVTMQTSIFDGLSKGKYDKRLSRLGISKADADNMWKQVDKHGRKEDGVWITNAKNWDSPALERMWGAAVRKESDRVIIIPGQEKPLFMSSELGKSIGQFRSFILSATQRVFIAGLQNQDHNALGGFASLVGMGMFTYYLKQQIAGRPLAEDPQEWIMEGIDRSGALGVLGEINNTVEKISSNSIGLRPVLGIDAPASKQVSRTVNESILGPTFGSLLSTTIAASNAVTSGEEMTEADVRTLRRLIPLQNLFYLRKGFDKVQESITDM